MKFILLFNQPFYNLVAIVYEIVNKISDVGEKFTYTNISTLHAVHEETREND